MVELASKAVQALIENAAARDVTADNLDLASYVVETAEASNILYTNQNERLNIDFTVERLDFARIQTLDPRVVRIPPGKNNELHKHSHETIFVILQGSGEVIIDKSAQKVKQGSIAFVPRWLFHQTKNTGDVDLVVLAITDFGFTSAVLGDYDKRTRVKENGADAVA